MRIGFDLAQTIPPVAGCGWYAHTLFDRLSALAPEHAFTAYTSFARWLNQPGTTAPVPVRPNVRDALAGCSFAETEAAWVAARQAGRTPFPHDIVHSTSFQAPRCTGAKLVVTVYDLSFWAAPDFSADITRLYCQADTLDALENADGLIFISEHARREFTSFLPRFRRQAEIATVVTPLAGRWPVVAMPPTDAGRYWLSVGSLEPRKNLGNLLTAHEAYHRSTRDPKPLWIAGGAGWKNADLLRRIERLQAEGLVRHLGYVEDARLPELYRGAQALVFPSWYEGFGLPVLEAMTQGCPVICTDTSSLPEVGGDAVHYIQPGDPDTLTRALVRLDQDDAYRSALRGRGLARARLFSWENTAKQTLAFYNQLLSPD